MNTKQADTVFLNGRISTLDPNLPDATAIAVAGDRILAVGSDKDISGYQGVKTTVLDLDKRRVIPGLIDSHIHVIRGSLNYNMELRWDGVDSLSTAMQMLKEQVDRTPAPQWVRVVGGFTEHQFAEKRLPTLDEINKVAPHTPVFILHLYDRALLNRAALSVCGFTKDSKDFLGSQIARDGRGNPTGLLIAKPNAMILYATLAKGPKLPLETALRLWTVSNTWFSNEEGKRGQINNGQLADFAVLSADYFAVAGDAIKDITSVLTVVGGKVVHGDGPYRGRAPNLPPPMPDWSPVKFYGGYQDFTRWQKESVRTQKVPWRSALRKREGDNIVYVRLFKLNLP